jgi:hypothetical protein
MMTERDEARFRRTADLPPELQAYFRALYEEAEAAFGGVVARHGLRTGLSREIAAARIALLDRHLGPIGPAMDALGTPVACRKGCYHCCSKSVETTPDEVFALIDHLASRLSPEAFDQIRHRAIEADRIGHGVASLERHRLKLFCPVLDPSEGACLGHTARPAACQGYLSLSLADCLADFADPPRVVAKPAAAAMITNVVYGTRDAVLEDLGLSGGVLELTAALAAAWRTDQPEQRWLDGEDIFAEARYRP